MNVNIWGHDINLDFVTSWGMYRYEFFITFYNEEDNLTFTVDDENDTYKLNKTFTRLMNCRNMVRENINIINGVCP